MPPTTAIFGTEIAAHVHQQYLKSLDDRTHSTASENPDREAAREPSPIAQCQELDRGSGREGCQGGEAPDGGGPEERSSRRTTCSASP